MSSVLQSFNDRTTEIMNMHGFPTSMHTWCLLTFDPRGAGTMAGWRVVSMNVRGEHLGSFARLWLQGDELDGVLELVPPGLYVIDLPGLIKVKQEMTPVVRIVSDKPHHNYLQVCRAIELMKEEPNARVALAWLVYGQTRIDIKEVSKLLNPAWA